MSDYTPTTDQVRANSVYAIARAGEKSSFDRWLDAVKAEVWDAAYQAGAEDTLASPRDARENPYRGGAR